MNFLGVGGLEFVLVFLVALFVVGPRRLADGVRFTRKFYTELRRQRQELGNLINEAIDADGIKETINVSNIEDELKNVRTDFESAGIVEHVNSAAQNLTIDQPSEQETRNIRMSQSKEKKISKASLADRGNAKITGVPIPEIDVPRIKKKTQNNQGKPNRSEVGS